MSFRFENLNAWQEAIKLASEVYSLTKNFSKNEQFGVINQLNRAVVSISSNIAEGCGRNSDGDLTRFLQISIGSLNEVVSLLHICLNQKYINQSNFDNFYLRCKQLARLIYALRNSLR